MHPVSNTYQDCAEPGCTARPGDMRTTVVFIMLFCACWCSGHTYMHTWHAVNQVATGAICIQINVLKSALRLNLSQRLEVTCIVVVKLILKFWWLLLLLPELVFALRPSCHPACISKLKCYLHTTDYNHSAASVPTHLCQCL